MTNWTDKMLDAVAALRNYGYCVTVEPIEGEEATFEKYLWGAFSKVEKTALYCAKRDRTRGRSQRALANLHFALPHPEWGVEVAS